MTNPAILETMARAIHCHDGRLPTPWDADMSAELKHCPFCGADKHMVMPPNCTKTGDYNPGDNAQPIVRCMTCYAEAMGNPWDYTKESAVIAWNRRTDLSQASVAAALEAAAAKCDEASAYRENQLNTQRVDEAQSNRWYAGLKQASILAEEIRSLITQSQHDALAAHVASEVAKARADDAVKINSQVLPRDCEFNNGWNAAIKCALAQIGAKS